MSSFKVDAEFEMYAAQTQSAFQEAAKMEQGASMGCTLPLGTQGKGFFTGATAGQSKPTVVNNQPIPGKPYVIMEMQVILPDAAKGKKYSRYFDLAHHEKYSATQKIADYLDFMQDAGMPVEVRQACAAVGSLKPAIEWAGAEPRHFSFTVTQGYRSNQYQPIPDIGAIPLPTATSALLGQNSQTPQFPAPTTPPPTPTPPTPPGPPTSPPTAPPTPPTPTVPPTPPPAPPTPSSPSPSTPEIGQMVTLYGQQFELVMMSNDVCSVRNPANGQVLNNIPVGQIS